MFLEHSTAPPVGAVDDATYTERLYHLQPGTTVLLYTDGLIERRGEPIQVGLERLRRAVTAAPSPVEELCESVLATLFADSAPTDDVAVLALGTQPVLGDRLPFDSMSPADVRSQAPVVRPSGPRVTFRIVGIVRRPLDLGGRGAAGGVIVPTPAFLARYGDQIGSYSGSVISCLITVFLAKSGLKATFS